MAPIDGIIILDSTGHSIISSHFRAHTPSYPALHIDAFNQALAKVKSARLEGEPTAELDPILWVSVPNIDSEQGGAWMETACFHIELEGMYFLVPVTWATNPLMPPTFILSFIETLTAYFGEVTETSIRDNFDIVYMLIEEMLDEGYTLTMETAMLEDIVLPPTLARRLLSAAGISGSLSQTNPPYSAPIPWRRPNVRHANNEVFFDIEERIDALIDKKGKAIRAEVRGEICCNAKMSGNPDLLVSFANPNIFTNCALHRCVRFRRWDEDQMLSFVPPDGRFKLFGYEMAEPSGPTKRLELPLNLKTKMSLNSNGGNFELTLASKTHARPLENIVVSINLGASVNSVSATVSGDTRGLLPGRSGRNPQFPVGGQGGGEWHFDSNKGGVLKWTIGELTANEKAASLVGSFVCNTEIEQGHEEDEVDTLAKRPALPSPARTVTVEFQINQHSMSGVRVDQVKVSNNLNPQKLFKGIRTMVKSGRYEVRW